jgi:hypothetical protein
MRVWGLITMSDRSVDSAAVEQKRRLAPPEKDEIFVPVMTGQGTRREAGRPDRRRGVPPPGPGPASRPRRTRLPGAAGELAAAALREAVTSGGRGAVHRLAGDGQAPPPPATSPPAANAKAGARQPARPAATGSPGRGWTPSRTAGAAPGRTSDHEPPVAGYFHPVLAH